MILLGALPGCTGLELPAISAGAAAAQSGVTFLSRGKAQAFEAASLEDALGAVRRAAEHLTLNSLREEVGEGRATLRFSDERGQVIVFVIERRAPRITRLQADVGVLGWTELATLFIANVQEELKRNGRAP